MVRSRRSPLILPQPDSDDPDARPPSKSQRKREMTGLQELGERLVGLSRERLQQLPLSERLFEAIRDAQRITAHEGKRRQLQYVGKLMRDAQIEPIQAQLAEWDGESSEQIAAFHQLERWRDKLLDTDDHFTAFMNLHPEADAQHLRAMIRAARKEASANAALLQGQEPQRKQFRALFQEIKRLQAPAAPPAEEEDPDD